MPWRDWYLAVVSEVGHRWRHHSYRGLMEDTSSGINSISIIVMNNVRKQFPSAFLYLHNALYITYGPYTYKPSTLLPLSYPNSLPPRSHPNALTESFTGKTSKLLVLPDSVWIVAAPLQQESSPFACLCIYMDTTCANWSGNTGNGFTSGTLRTPSVTRQ